PVLIGSDTKTWHMDPNALEAFLTEECRTKPEGCFHRETGRRVRAVTAVHLLGSACEIDRIADTARRHGVLLVEDCAEAHGATYKGRKVGGLGHIGCFSFYANKIITTGEGGMLTTNDPALAESARSLRSLAFGKANKFMHSDIGYNYRMTNLQAAIGCAQLTKIEEIIARKIKLAEFYAAKLASEDSLQLPVTKPYAKNVYWMYHINLRGKAASRREEILKKLLEKGVETREGFIPYNLQEIFIKDKLTYPGECPRAARAATTSFYLPSGPLLTVPDMEYVTDSLKAVLKDLRG
ncbi:MAG: DegT/DnrJ/EryC1/StrS family aminotransferase, partial [Elusimicrobiota bacterium]